jgi:hypothetical protein
MTTQKDVKRFFKSVDRRLRTYRTRQERILALEAFHMGFESSVNEKFPLKYTFSLTFEEVSSSNPLIPNLYHQYACGRRLVGDVNASLCRGEYYNAIRAEIARRKARLARPNWRERLEKVLNELYKSCGQVPGI